ncbi:MAG: ACT domain-containing protein [Streptosporangiaceae bacterium]
MSAIPAKPPPGRGEARVLRVLAGRYAMCRLAASAAVPPWASGTAAEFLSVTRSRDELSVICPEEVLPDEVSGDTGWHCLRIEGSSGLDEPGVLVSVAGPLANAGLSVFAIATYDTDYLLVTELDRAAAALRTAGHTVLPAS